MRASEALNTSLLINSSKKDDNVQEISVQNKTREKRSIGNRSVFDPKYTAQFAEFAELVTMKLTYLDYSAEFLLWLLACGWALKSAQKYGKKGGGKRISKKVWNLLQEYFLEGNVNKSERHTAQSMLAQLKQNVERGVIEEDEVPKLETISNWISRYASQHRQEAAEAVARAQKKESGM